MDRMDHAQNLRTFISGLALAHRPEPGADLPQKNYAQTLRLLNEFWQRTGKPLERSLKRDCTAQCKAASKAIRALVAWVGKAFPEYLEALKLEGYDGEVLRCAKAWKDAWLQRLELLAADPLVRPLISVGIAPRHGADPHPDAPWAKFGGLFGEPGSENFWPDNDGAPRKFRDVSRHMNGTRHADWTACGGGIPRDFHDALSRQSRSRWTAWRALEGLLTSRSTRAFWAAQEWTVAASVVVFEWTTATRRQDVPVEPLPLGERRPAAGEPLEGQYAFSFPWLTDWWKSGAAVSSRDAESFVLCCMALLEHLGAGEDLVAHQAATATGPLTRPINWRLATRAQWTAVYASVIENLTRNDKLSKSELEVLIGLPARFLSRNRGKKIFAAASAWISTGKEPREGWYLPEQGSPDAADYSSDPIEVLIKKERDNQVHRSRAK